MTLLFKTVGNFDLSFEERMTAVLIIHALTEKDELSDKLKEIEIWEGGSISINMSDDVTSVSGDNGCFSLHLSELMKQTEFTRKFIQEQLDKEINK